MIIRGNPAKRYNPEKLKHQIRRGMKIEMDRHFIQLPYKSKAVDLLMSIPGLKKVMDSLIHAGQKIIALSEKKKLSKTKNRIIKNRIPELSKERRRVTDDITLSK